MIKYLDFFNKQAELGNKVPAQLTVDMLRFFESLYYSENDLPYNFDEIKKETKDRFIGKDYDFKDYYTEDFLIDDEMLKIKTPANLEVMIDNVFRYVIHVFYNVKLSEHQFQRDEVFDLIYSSFSHELRGLSKSTNKKITPYFRAVISAFITHKLGFKITTNKPLTNPDLFQKSRHLVRKSNAIVKNKRED